MLAFASCSSSCPYQVLLRPIRNHYPSLLVNVSYKIATENDNSSWTSKVWSFSLRWGDSLQRFCLSICPSICLPFCMSICYTLIIFQKRGLETVNINLSNKTKLTLLDSLLQEVTTGEIQVATSLIWPSLYFLIHFSRRLGWLKSK